MTTPSPYKTIAVASTFSPRFLQVLAEAKRVRDRFDCDLDFIYVGEKSEETAGKFREVLRKLSLPDQTRIHYQHGDPADGILRALGEARIDMIVAGALEKELVMHQFLGNVARRLVRDAPCSVMLFTHPDETAKPFQKMVFVADYSEHGLHALRRTLQLAQAEKCECLYVIRVITSFDKARASLHPEAWTEGVKSADDEESELEQFVLSAGTTEVPIEARCIRGNTGFAVADFVQSIEADLLVVPVSPGDSNSLPPNVAWLTDVIPCNLWIIR